MTKLSPRSGIHVVISSGARNLAFVMTPLGCSDIYRDRSKLPQSFVLRRRCAIIPCEESCEMPKRYFVYIMTNRSRTLYVGVTNDLERRVLEHKAKALPGFKAKYRINQLVYYEEYPDRREAIAHE